MFPFLGLLPKGGLVDIDNAFAANIFFGFIVRNVLDAVDDGFKIAGGFQNFRHQILRVILKGVTGKKLDAREQDLQRLAHVVRGRSGPFKDPLETLIFFHVADVDEGLQEEVATCKMSFPDRFEDGDYFTRAIEHAALGMVDFLVQNR